MRSNPSPSFLSAWMRSRAALGQRGLAGQYRRASGPRNGLRGLVSSKRSRRETSGGSKRSVTQDEELREMILAAFNDISQLLLFKHNKILTSIQARLETEELPARRRLLLRLRSPMAGRPRPAVAAPGRPQGTARALRAGGFAAALCPTPSDARKR